MKQNILKHKILILDIHKKTTLYTMHSCYNEHTLYTIIQQSFNTLDKTVLIKYVNFLHKFKMFQI
jgi:hypothetical protein